MTQVEAFEVLRHLGDNYINLRVPVGALSDNILSQYHAALHALKKGDYSTKQEVNDNIEDGERSN